MKSEVELWTVCLREAGSLFGVRTQRDEAYALSRIKNEGLAFLTITLPRFEKDFVRCLSLGRVSSDSFCGFHRRRGLPAFMQGFLSRVFDVDGALREHVDPSIIRSIRQVLLLLSKVEYPVSDYRKRQAIAAYVSTDVLLPELSKDLLMRFEEAAESLLGDYLRTVEHRIWSRSWLPQHSGGALATRETSNGRWSNSTWTDRLQAVIPYWDDLLMIPSESPEYVKVLARHEEPPAKLVLVPKTMKGPRVIVEEPCHMQYVQQGIFSVMSEVLREERFSKLHKSFSWDSQERNRTMAQQGSIDGSYATIDLSEASDRVSLQLVEHLFAGSRYLRSLVKACRSEKVLLPDGGVVDLNKFASMGSSLCFPVESMVFYVIASMGEASYKAVVPSTKRLSPSGDIRIYGDDIIVSTEVAHQVLLLLESYGLKVNVDKTFHTGYFRESCGSDWYKGRDVSVFRLRHPLPEEPKQLELLRNTIAFHNLVYDQGWFRVAAYIRDKLLSVFSYVPRVPVGVRGHGLWSWEGPFATRTNPDLHRVEYKTLNFVESKPSDELDGYGAFKKSLTLLSSSRSSSSTETVASSDHLKCAGRSRCVGKHIVWYADW